jgi:transposase-like protein
MGRRSPFRPTEKRDAVLAVLSKPRSIADVCSELGVSEQTLARWREQAVPGAEQALADQIECDGWEAALEKNLTEVEHAIGRRHWRAISWEKYRGD